MLPVADTVRHTHASPRSAVGFLIHAAGLDARAARAAHQPDHAGRLLHGRRADRGARAASPATRWRRASAASRTNWSCASSPAGRERFEAKRAAALGFKAETSFDDIIRAHIEDELGGKVAG